MKLGRPRLAACRTCLRSTGDTSRYSALSFFRRPGSSTAKAARLLIVDASPMPKIPMLPDRSRSPRVFATTITPALQQERRMSLL